MTTIGLSTHFVRVKRMRKSFERLDAFGPDETDLFDVFNRILKGLHKTARTHEETQHIIEVKEVQAKKQRREIYGIIDSGAYGTQSVGRDIRDYSVAYRRTIHHAETMPFFFHFNLPAKRDQGLLLLQRTGIYSIQSTLSAFLDDAFRKLHPDYHLSFPVATSQAIIDAILSEDSELTVLHLLRHRLSADITESLNIQRPIRGSMDLAIKFTDAGFPLLSRLRQIVNKERPVQDLLELPEFPYDDAKIEVKHRGRKRTMNVGDPRKGLRADYDVTEDVSRKDGEITLESLYHVSSDILRELSEQLYGGG